MAYRDKREYRAPPRMHQRISRTMAVLAAAGLSPRRVVVLEVAGWRSGLPRRTVVVLAEHGGERFVISLGGKAEWVRNVRAAAGAAVIVHGRRRLVRLVELPTTERAPVLRAYAARRAASRSAGYVCREYFGVRPGAPLRDFVAIADRYPVFEITPGP